ncbi:hypothetical protein TrCOL_g10810 [Triparma columacea]|uniref:Uncharacterized protein n=1 Tax=Triparma columacea TaxID=722753 RepID=A0A9W7LFR1_9STRA|nr:hypothetical protein TrCOL_g10810 [Triparma columacea]
MTPWPPTAADLLSPSTQLTALQVCLQRLTEDVEDMANVFPVAAGQPGLLAALASLAREEGEAGLLAMTILAYLARVFTLAPLLTSTEGLPIGPCHERVVANAGVLELLVVGIENNPEMACSVLASFCVSRGTKQTIHDHPGLVDAVAKALHEHKTMMAAFLFFGLAGSPALQVPLAHNPAVLGALLGVLEGCDDDKVIEYTVAAVSELTKPEENRAIMAEGGRFADVLRNHRGERGAEAGLANLQ